MKHSSHAMVDMFNWTSIGPCLQVLGCCDEGTKGDSQGVLLEIFVVRDQRSQAEETAKLKTSKTWFWRKNDVTVYDRLKTLQPQTEVAKNNYCTFAIFGLAG